MTSKPTWTSTISFGNVLTVIAMLMGMAASFFTLQNQAQANAKDILELQHELGIVESRSRALEISKAANDQKFANILQLLDRIDARLERIEREGLNR